MKRYLIYHLRWQFSALVMMPIMILLEKYLPLWQNLMLGQFIGAIIFWSIDKYIFKNHKSDNIETELTKALDEDMTIEPSVSERKI